jgi:hypothetical protein
MMLVKRKISYTQRLAFEQPNSCAREVLKALTPGATAFRIEKAQKQAKRHARANGEDSLSGRPGAIYFLGVSSILP